MTAPVWKTHDHRARLDLPRVAAAIHLLEPGQGLADLQVDGRVLANTRLLSVGIARVEPSQAPTSIDHYVRQRDLVANYLHRPQPEMRTQAYWRVASYGSPTALAAIELVLSVQTDLLDSTPRLTTESSLGACQALCLREESIDQFCMLSPDDPSESRVSGSRPCYLFRLDDERLSYAEMVHPADAHESCHDVSQHQAGVARVQLRHELFGGQLEKGVILRARVLGVLLERRDDEAAAAHVYASFLREKLPLTT